MEINEMTVSDAVDCGLFCVPLQAYKKRHHHPEG